MSSTPDRPVTGPRPRNKNRLLAWSRKWHTWIGLAAALFLVVFGATGIILNYKKPLLTALGLEPQKKETSKAVPGPVVSPSVGPEAGAKTEFTTLNGWEAARISPAEALRLARQELGEVSLDRIELKHENGALVWKIKDRQERETLIHAETGVRWTKGRYEKVNLKPAGADADAGTGTVRSFDWGKFLLDLHTGKIGGEPGKAIMSLAAMLLLFLTFSGAYMYAKPVLIRRANARSNTSVHTSAPASAASASVRLGASVTGDEPSTPISLTR